MKSILIKVIASQNQQLSVCIKHMQNKRTLLEKCLNISLRNQQSQQIQYYQSSVRDENLRLNCSSPKYHPLSSSKKKYKTMLNKSIKPISLKDGSASKKKRCRQQKKNNEKMIKYQYIPVKNRKIRKTSINLQGDALNIKEHTQSNFLFKNSLFQQLVSFFRKTLQKQRIHQKQIQQIVNSSYFINELKFISSIYINSNMFKQKSNQICINCTNEKMTDKPNNNAFSHKIQQLQSQIVESREQFKNLFSLFKQKQQQFNRILESYNYYHQNFKRTDIENKRIFQALQQMKLIKEQSQINFNKKMNEMNELLYQKICEIQNQKSMRKNIEQEILEISEMMLKKDLQIKKWKKRYREITQFVDKQVLITKFEYKEEQIYQQSKHGVNLQDPENFSNQSKASSNVGINKTCL